MTTQLEVRVPDIGDFEEVEIIEVLVSKGDFINIDDPIIAVESDKATMEIPSGISGEITELLISVGDMVSEGSVMVMVKAISEDGDTDKGMDSNSSEIETAKELVDEIPEVTEITENREAAPVEAKIVKTKGVSPEHVEMINGSHNLISTNKNSGLPYASPAVRRISRELGVDLSLLKGSGEKNRITKNDVNIYIKKVIALAAEPQTGSAIPVVPEIDFTPFGETNTVELNRIKRLSGPHLHRAWLNIPHVTNHDEVDITDLEIFRKSLIPEFAQRGDKITIVAFALMALMKSLKHFPTFNSTLHRDGKQLILKEYFNIGVAVNTEQGLVVPVIREVDNKGLVAIVTELNEISQRARDGKLLNTDLQGGCMSISSLGGLAGTSFTPIVNAPEVAILGIARAEMKPVWNGSEFEPRLMLPLSLSYDHRVIDGAEAAQFLIFFKGIFKDIRRLVM